MTLKVTSRSEITVQKQMAIGPGVHDRVTNHGANTLKLKYHDKSPVPMREHAHFAHRLASGASTVDLLNLPAMHAPSPVTAGMKVQIIKVQNPNPFALTVHPAAVDGYPLSFTVPPQSFVHLECDNRLPPVEANCHLLSATGQGEEISNWTIVLG